MNKLTKKTELVKKQDIEILDPEQWREHMMRHHHDDFWQQPLVNLVVVPKEMFDRRYEARYRHNKKHLFIDLFLGFTIVGLLFFNAFVFFGVTPLTFFNRMVVEIDMNETVLSGQAHEYRIAYHNHNRLPVHGMNIALDVPQNFHIHSVEPFTFDVATNTIDLGELPPGANGEIFVRGAMIEAAQTQHRFSAFASYEKALPQGQTIRFAAADEAQVQVEGTAVTMELLAPQEIHRDTEAISMRFIVENKTDQLIKNIVVDGAEFADLGTIIYAGELFQASQQRWVIPELAAHEQAILSWQVQLKTQETLPDVPIRVGVLEHLVITPQGEFVYQPTMRNEDVLPKIRINEQNTVRLGAENQLVATLVGNKQENVQITIEYPDLGIYETFIIKDTKSVAFEPRLHEALYQKNLQFGGKIELSYTNKDGEEIFVEFEAPAVSVQTEAHISAELRYFAEDGRQLGRGPLPPIVGEKTRLWLILGVSNTYNELQRTNIRVQLAENAQFTGICAGNELIPEDSLKVAENSRFASFQLPNVPYFTEIINKQPAIQCEVEFTPQIAYIGQKQPIVTNVSGIAQDSFTLETFQFGSQSLDSGLENDDIAQQKGGGIITTWE